jgi:phosphatidylglycerol---prolipoprotein diacylglyceryl transferase
VIARAPAAGASPGFPRYFNIGGHWVNSYKFFLCIGIYAGTVVSAAVAERSGLSPLRMGLACLACAISGLVGARIYHLLVFAPHYWRQRSWAAVWDSTRGGWSIFGALLTVAFTSFLLAALVRIPAAVFWDHMITGIVFGGIWVRLGCVFNGCCEGRETTAWYGVWLHDTRGWRRWRIPVQFMEIGWWILAGAGLLWLWPRSFPPGTYALGVLAWYGLGRFWLEPLRGTPDLVSGWVRINQVVAGLLALAAGCGLLLLA